MHLIIRSLAGVSRSKHSSVCYTIPLSYQQTHPFKLKETTKNLSDSATSVSMLDVKVPDCSVTKRMKKYDLSIKTTRQHSTEQTARLLEHALWTDKTKGKRFGHKTQTQHIITKTSFQLSSMMVGV